MCFAMEWQRRGLATVEYEILSMWNSFLDGKVLIPMPDAIAMLKDETA